MMPWNQFGIGGAGVNPLDQFLLSQGQVSAAGLNPQVPGAGGVGPLGYLGAANFLLNPPRGPADMMQIGSPMQGNQPIVTQTQPWGAPAASGAMQGAMAGAPFGPIGMGIGGGLGYGMGKK